MANWRRPELGNVSASNSRIYHISGNPRNTPLSSTEVPNSSKPMFAIERLLSSKGRVLRGRGTDDHAPPANLRQPEGIQIVKSQHDQQPLVVRRNGVTH